ncbi:MAG: translational GTPase TypA [Anaerolineaceae bacterium]|nr:translational GTPase TypA [Anaerolineaceae bacterium]
MKIRRNNLRNIAIIAHVDHGKTTLVDSMLRQAKIFRENQHVAERVMDSNDLERERGITILSKNTAITIPDPQTGELVKINIVDTPGHADFGGEVERIMNMVDGVLLLVDAAEGPKPQTRFVLKQAIKKNLPAVVVINKMDRREALPDRALDMTFDLFIELGAADELADFPILYLNAISGQCGPTHDLSPNLQPLFETILEKIPAPEVDVEEPLQILVTNLGYDEYRGTTAVGRIHRGKLRQGQQLARIQRDGTIAMDIAKYLFVFYGLEKTAVEEVEAGDIVTIAGLENIAIGETLADPEYPEALPTIEVEAPTVRMTFGVNTSPLSGQDGKKGSSRNIRDRLMQELRVNIALRVEETSSTDRFLVSGRGELHLGILIEIMRREGYEFEVSRPEAIVIEDENGIKMEPYEEVHIDVIQDYIGVVVEMLGSRQGLMKDMRNNADDTVHLIYSVPTRTLLGFRYHFMTATHGLGIVNTVFSGYDVLQQVVKFQQSRSIVARETGVTTTYGLRNAEERGMLFLAPGTPVYEGMVVGENARPEDLTINVCKKRALTNMRQSNKEIAVRLSTPRIMSLDESIEFLSPDELLEVTPNNLRIRKRILDTQDRGKYIKKQKELFEEE